MRRNRCPPSVGIRTYYGTAARAYLARLAHDRSRDPDRLRDFLAEHREAFLVRHVPEGAAGQVRSVASRLALIAAAGELARDYGVLPWPEGEAARAAAACFCAWLTERGGPGAQEDEAALACVQRFIELHGESRFTEINDPHEEGESGMRNTQPRGTHNRAGFRRLVGAPDDLRWEYLFLTGVWKGEVCKGLDPRRAAATLAQRGLLKAEGLGRFQIKVRISGHGRPWVYLVSGAVLGTKQGD